MTLVATGRLALSLLGFLALATQAHAQGTAADDVCGTLASNPRYRSIPRPFRLQYQMFFINCARRVPSPDSYSHGASCAAPLPPAERSCTREPTGEELDAGHTSCPNAVLYSCQQLTRCMDLEHLTDADATHCPMFQEDRREVTCSTMGGYAGYCAQFAPLGLQILRALGSPKDSSDPKTESDAIAPRSVDRFGDGPAVFPTPSDDAAVEGAGDR